MTKTMPERTRRVVRTGHVNVARPVAEAIELFTAEGERLWVPGWEPSYPDEDLADTTTRGTVWVTATEGVRTTWIVAEVGDLSYRYALVRPDVVAGLVSVAARSAGDGSSVVTVTYDVTALGPMGETYLEDLAVGFEERMADWSAAIAALPARAGSH